MDTNPHKAVEASHDALAQLVPAPIRRWVYRRVGNPLEWSQVDRCLLLLVIIGPWPFLGWWGLRYLQIHPEYGSTYNWEFVTKILIPFYQTSAGLAVVALVLGLFLRRRSPENRFLVHAMVQTFLIHSACMVYFTGTLTTIMWVPLAAGLMVLALLFDTWSVFWGSVSATLVVSCTFFATLRGWLPYAPIFAEAPFGHGRMYGAGPMLMAFYLTFALVLSLLFFFFLYAVGRWRDHERQVMELSEFLRRTFGRYLSKDVLEALIENPDGVALGGTKREVTILMTDLRGFTQLSERLDPQRLVRLMNRYFQVMMEICERYHGTVNDIIGDALLVTFGAPKELENHARSAVACAIEMQNAMAAINEENVADELPRLEMGIGLNTAEVVVGNIGSERRSKFGVIGSGVNLASRIESSTVGGQVLASHSVLAKAGDVLRIDASWEIKAKGAEAALAVYEIGGIGAPYQLALEQGAEAPVLLARAIPISWQLIEGKQVGSSMETGRLVGLSHTMADVEIPSRLEGLTNLKLNLTGVAPELASRGFYAKIIAQPNSGPQRLRFTAVPPEVSAFFEAHLLHAGPERAAKS